VYRHTTITPPEMRRQCPKDEQTYQVIVFLPIHDSNHRQRLACASARVVKQRLQQLFDVRQRHVYDLVFGNEQNVNVKYIDTGCLEKLSKTNKRLKNIKEQDVASSFSSEF